MNGASCEDDAILERYINDEPEPELVELLAEEDYYTIGQYRKSDERTFKGRTW